MRLNSLLKYLLLEEKTAKPEAPEDSPLGRYLFAPMRIDVPEEENTPLEDTIQQDLKLHYLGKDLPVEKSLIKLMNFEKQGLYSKLLKPPKGLVYRFLNNVKPEDASRMFLGGLSIEEITSKANEAFYVPSIGIVEKPSLYSTIHNGETNISSWTIDPKNPSLSDFSESRYGNVSILLVANTEGNNFFMNPKNINKYMTSNFLGPNTHLLRNEKEVIGYGPISALEASYMFRGVIKPGSSTQKLLLSALKQKKVPAKNNET